MYILRQVRRLGQDRVALCHWQVGLVPRHPAVQCQYQVPTPKLLGSVATWSFPRATLWKRLLVLPVSRRGLPGTVRGAMWQFLLVHLAAVVEMAEPFVLPGGTPCRRWVDRCI